MIVSKDDFYRAQSALASRNKGGRGRKGEHYTSLFGGIAKCDYCAEPMTIRHPKRGRATQFYCKGVLNGNGCKHRPWNYLVFEASVLSLVAELDMETVIHGGVGTRSDTITEQLQALEGQKKDAQKAIDAFIEMIRENSALRKSIQPAMDIDQAKVDRLDSQMMELEAERNEIHSKWRTSEEGNRITFPKDVSESELYQLRAKAAQQIRT